MCINAKNVNKPMCRTFTTIILLFAMTIFLPKFSIAKSASFEVSATDARYGDKDLIKFYPNPLVSDATIKVSDDIDLDRTKVSIIFYNMVGSEVYRITQMKDYEEKITRDVFKNAGMYFYQLKIDDKVVSTGRITVK